MLSPANSSSLCLQNVTLDNSSYPVQLWSPCWSTPSVLMSSLQVPSAMSLFLARDMVACNGWLTDLLLFIDTCSPAVHWVMVYCKWMAGKWRGMKHGDNDQWTNPLSAVVPLLLRMLPVSAHIKAVTLPHSLSHGWFLPNKPSEILNLMFYI